MAAKKGPKKVKVRDLTARRGGRAKGGLLMHGDFSTFSAARDTSAKAIGNALQTATQK